MIIILNGPINAGKSTVTKLLWEMIPNTAHIEIDKLREFIDWMEGSEGWQMSFEAAIPVAKKFIEKGLNVIITYHISKESYEQIVTALKPYDNHIFAFILKPKLESLLQNRGSRQLNEKEMNRIKETYNTATYSDYGETIDNTNQAPQETAQIIYDKVKHTIKQGKNYPRRDKSKYLK